MSLYFMRLVRIRPFAVCEPKNENSPDENRENGTTMTESRFPSVINRMFCRWLDMHMLKLKYLIFWITNTNKQKNETKHKIFNGFLPIYLDHVWHCLWFKLLQTIKLFMALGRVCSIDTLELKLLCRPTLALQIHQKPKKIKKNKIPKKSTNYSKKTSRQKMT